MSGPTLGHQGSTTALPQLPPGEAARLHSTPRVPPPTVHPAAWVRKDDACDASTPPLNGDVGNCTDTLVSGTSCVPECHPGYVLQGVTSCTNRVLTQEAVCVGFTDDAELKAAVDACIWIGSCEKPAPSDVYSCGGHDYLIQRCDRFQRGHAWWAVSQVTDASDLFAGRVELLPGSRGLDRSAGRRSRRGCSRAPTPGC